MVADRNEVVLIQQGWPRVMNACSRPLAAVCQLGSCARSGWSPGLPRTSLAMGTAMLSCCLKAH